MNSIVEQMNQASMEAVEGMLTPMGVTKFRTLVEDKVIRIVAGDFYFYDSTDVFAQKARTAQEVVQQTVIQLLRDINSGGA